MSLKNLKQVDALIGSFLIQKIQGARILDGLSLLCKDSKRLLGRLSLNSVAGRAVSLIPA
jgi:hypothetical protein